MPESKFKQALAQGKASSRTLDIQGVRILRVAHTMEGARSQEAICGASPKELDFESNSFSQKNYSRYDHLLSLGLIAVGSATRTGSPILSGASECVTSLDWDQTLNVWIVEKRLSTRGFTIPGSDVRLLQEANFQKLPQIETTGLFPRIRLIDQNEDSLMYVQEFIPRYTLADLLLQGNLTAITLIQNVSNALEALQSKVYAIPSLQPRQSYPELVALRFMSAATQSPILRQFWLDGAEIDDKVYPSIRQIVTELLEDSKFAALSSGRSTYCHGDLILDSILPATIHSAGAECRFIDPNARNCWFGADVGKLLMNCETHYDLALRPTRCICLKSDQPCSNYECSDTIRLLYSDLASWLIHNFNEFAASPKDRVPEAVIYAQAGLNCLAIAPFHFIAHNRPERAVGFVKHGLRLLDLAMHA